MKQPKEKKKKDNISVKNSPEKNKVPYDPDEIRRDMMQSKTERIVRNQHKTNAGVY